MDTILTPQIRFCPCCGEELTDKGKTGHLVKKACPSSSIGDVIYIETVKHYICTCGFVSTFLDK